MFSPRELTAVITVLTNIGNKPQHRENNGRESQWDGCRWREGGVEYFLKKVTKQWRLRTDRQGLGLRQRQKSEG